MQSRTWDLAEPFLLVIHPTRSQRPSKTFHPVLSKGTKFPESVNNTLNHNLSTPGAKEPEPVNVNHWEYLWCTDTFPFWNRSPTHINLHKCFSRAIPIPFTPDTVTKSAREPPQCPRLTWMGWGLCFNHNKWVNNYINNEPDLPAGQVSGARALLLNNFRFKKKSKQSAVKIKQLHAAEIPWIKIAISP